MESLKRVLIVDDEPDVRFILRHMFENGDYEVAEAINGAVALECINEAAPDLVCTDLMMPVMNGNELIERLRSNPDTATIPILSMTSNPDESVGADLVLVKFPTARDLLAAALSILMGEAP
jgi:CheY-like chemotaxis protein